MIAAAEADWRAFFADVGVHCALARQTSTGPEREADSTLAGAAKRSAASSPATPKEVRRIGLKQLEPYAGVEVRTIAIEDVSQGLSLGFG